MVRLACTHATRRGLDSQMCCDEYIDCSAPLSAETRKEGVRCAWQLLVGHDE